MVKGGGRLGVTGAGSAPSRGLTREAASPKREHKVGQLRGDGEAMCSSSGFVLT